MQRSIYTDNGRVGNQIGWWGIRNKRTLIPLVIPLALGNTEKRWCYQTPKARTSQTHEGNGSSIRKDASWSRFVGGMRKTSVFPFQPILQCPDQRTRGGSGNGSESNKQMTSTGINFEHNTLTKEKNGSS